MKKFSLIIVSQLWYILSFGQCFDPLLLNGRGNETQLCSPQLDQVYTADETPLLWANTGKGSKKIRVEVYHDNTNIDGATVSVNELVYAFEREVDNCRVLLNRDIPNTCGRSGLFSIHIKIGHNASGAVKCKKKSEAHYYSTFIKLPDLTVAPPIQNLENLLVCPGQNVKLDLRENLVPGGSHNHARWYDAQTGALIHEGYVNFVNIAPLELKTFLVSFVERKTLSYTIYDEGGAQTHYYDCEVESPKIPYSVIGIDYIGLQPPVSPTRFLCRPKVEEITINNPNGLYTGVRWYNDVARTDMIHDGFTLSQHFTNTTTLFLEYYKDYGGCEQVSTVPATANIIVANDEITSKISEFNLTGNQNPRIYDYRDFQDAACQSDEAFFEDLRDYENEGFSFSSSNPLITSEVSVNHFWMSDYNTGSQFALMRDGETKDNFTADLYLETIDNERIVCADHIGTQQGEYGSRKYRYYADFNYQYQATIPGQGTITQTQNCPVQVKQITVETRPLNESNPDNLCLDVTLDHVQTLAQSLLSGCQQAQTQNVCPESTVTIGPTADQIFGLYTGLLPRHIIDLQTQYQWTPTTGLSNPQIANPTVSYNDIPSDPNELFKYQLNIRYPDGTETTFCEILYKCDQCGTQNDNPITGISLD